MKFLGRFWQLCVVDILKTNKLKVPDFFFPNWESYRDLNLSDEALFAGLVWLEIKNNIRTYKYVHVRSVYLTQKSSVWTRTFLDLRFTRFSVYWSAPKLRNSIKKILKKMVFFYNGKKKTRWTLSSLVVVHCIDTNLHIQCYRGTAGGRDWGRMSVRSCRPCG